MNRNASTCHPGDDTKSLNRLPYLAGSFSRNFKSFEEKILGGAKPDAVRKPWRSIQTSA